MLNLSKVNLSKNGIMIFLNVQYQNLHALQNYISLEPLSVECSVNKIKQNELSFKLELP